MVTIHPSNSKSALGERALGTWHASVRSWMVPLGIVLLMFLVVFNSSTSVAPTVHPKGDEVSQKTRNSTDTTDSPPIKHSDVQKGQPPEPKSVDEQLSEFWQNHQNCSILDQLPDTPTTVIENSSAPTLWMPSYPDSLDDSSLRALVATFTGLSNPVKNYYAQNANFRKCHSATSATIFCSLIHPMVEMNRGGPTDERSIVYILRNPWTLFPAHSNGKAMRYHGVQGQEDASAWNKFRNQWLETALISGWKDQISAWLPPPPCNATKYNTQNYTIRQWLPMEQWFSPHQGPAVAKRLIDTIADAGYRIPILEQGLQLVDANDDQQLIPCLWFKSVEETMRTMMQQEYFDFTSHYTPSYTEHQRGLLVQAIQELRDEIREEYHLENAQGDNLHRRYPDCTLTVSDANRRVLWELLDILQGYETDIAQRAVLSDEDENNGDDPP